jgi:hypothetical protein
VFERHEEVRKAVASVVESKLTIWNARLDLAIQASDVRKIDALLSHSPVADGGGCDCSCGGLMPIPLGDIAQQRG